jgi:adenylate cyclase
MNPRFCNTCFSLAETHPGGAEIELTMLFADIRGSTGLAERLGTAEFSRLVGRFYDAVTSVLVGHDALIDRLIGDEVIGLFIPLFSGTDHARRAIQSAQEILRATGHSDPGGPWVPLGAGVHTGTAYVGSVGTQGVTDFTALGDDVNATARLASMARAGEILVSSAALEASGIPAHGLESRTAELKGREVPMTVSVLRV